MSASTSIDVVFSLNFDIENLYKILQAGSDCGFIYYDQTQDDRYFNPPIITVNQAVNLILNMSKELIDDGRGYIYTRIDDTYVFLFIRSDDGLISVAVTESSYPWRKEFWRGSRYSLYGFDVARYIRVVLRFSRKFKICKFVMTKF